MRRRHGTGLPELLVTLALAGIVAATASRGLVQHLRQRRDRDAQARADEIVREVEEVLRAELAHAAGDVRTLGDTALEIASQRLVAVACDLSASRLVIAPTQAWWSAPRAGDSLAVLDSLTATEWRETVTAVGTQRASARCPDGGTRLTLGAPPPASVPVLRLPVRIWRVVRYVTYRASDGLWWLGERPCTPVCGVAQPIAGPLLAPGVGGLVIAPYAPAGGVPTAVDIAVAAAVGVQTAHLAARLPLAVVP